MRKTTLKPWEKIVEKQSRVCQNNFVLTFFLAIAFTAFNFNHLAAQCTLACTDVNISVNMDCEALVTHQMFADTSSCMNGDYVVNVYYDDEIIPTSPLITSYYIDKVVKLEVVDMISGNSCWSYGNVEEKFPPIIDCIDTTILSCGEVPGDPGPTAIDNCDQVVDVILIDEDFTLLDCDTTYSSRLTRYYTAVDDNGNYADTCAEVFLLERLDGESIVFPDSLLVATNNNLNCTEDFDTINVNGIPEPEEINSFPTIDGETLFPFQQYCNATVTYLDVPLPPIHCTKVLMRVWTVSEWWCNQQVPYIGTQIIEIADTTPPEITCPLDFTVSAGLHDCEASVLLPALGITDDCQDIDDIRVDIKYPGGFLQDQNGGLVELSAGVHTIEYRAFDQCGNMENCFMTVTVVDDNPPSAVCDQFTVVSLSLNGLGKIFAETFDDGSVDNCENVWFKALRMDIGACDEVNGDDNEDIFGYQEYFDDYVKFCCDDIGSGNMVRFRVYDIDPGEGPVVESRHLQGGDLFGRYNECMVEVEVQDKLPPVITCPPDITVSCEFDFDENDLSIFGDVVIGQDLREEIIIDDPDYSSTPINWGLDGYTTDNCIVDLDVIITKKLNTCGVGDITRLFIAEDAGGRTATCLQRIDIVRTDEFDEDNIDWPNNYEAYDLGCNAGTLPPDSLPSGSDYPVVEDDECTQVFTSYDDDVFIINDNSDACFKILRTWKVIDWCGVYEDQNGNEVFPIFEHVQVIKVFNTLDPVIISDCDSTSVCTYDEDCLDGEIELNFLAEDDCTPQEELIYSYRLDIDSDDIFDGIFPGNDASGSYPIGNHEILWIVEDLCGNQVTCTQKFSIINCKKPSPKCHSGIVTVIMEEGGTVDVWASEFDAGSDHVCGYDVIASFSEDPTDNVATFTCDDLGIMEIEIWITDENGNQDFCVTTIEIQDDNNSNACDDEFDNGDIVGIVMTEEEDVVEGVTINLFGAQTETESGENGLYSFDDMPFGDSYAVSPYDNDDHLNGVSTYDIVLIQKHILGIEEITSPYKLIAGDVNNSEEVTALDIVELRKLLLGYQEEFNNNTSWRFIDSDFEFTNPTEPWEDDFTEEYLIDPFDENMQINWTAVKIGDINNSSEKHPFVGEESEFRSDNKLVLYVQEASFEAGQVVSIDVRAEDMNNIAAYQHGWKFDTELLAYTGMTSKALNIDENFFGMTHLEEGHLSTLWYNQSEVLGSDELLYTLNFTAQKAGSLSEAVKISSDYIAAESYTIDAEKQAVDLEMRYDEAVANGVILYQNTPNPFTEQTDISFLMSQKGEATISVLDVTGKVLWANTGYFDKGFNVISVQAKSFNASGVLYYRLESGDFVETKKMIKL